MTRESAFLKDIQAEDFALYETVLYLNGHPTCPEALAYYGQQRSKIKEMKKQYESTCGPLTVYGNCDQNCWQWVSTPWPWEKEAN